MSPSTNRLVGSPYSYDSSGNMTDDGINTLVYDGESHAVSATNGSNSGAYVYDGNGLRVKRCVPNCTSPTTSTVYLFSGSKVIAEYDNGAGVGSPSREYIYAGAALLARTDSSGTKYYHQDHLSNRLVTDSSGNTLAQMGTFPYGESWYNASSDKLLFTTYERDSESTNDYAQARYHVSGLGRFSSPDPVSGSTSDPQSLNRYSYVRNMPVMLTDPFGTCPPVVENRDPDQDHSQDSQSGGGPYVADLSDPSAADPPGQVGNQGSCQQAPWYYTIGGGGGGGTLDWMDLGGIPGGLLGNGESNDTAVVPLGDSLGFNPWVTDPFGHGWQNPSNGCVIGLGSADIYCGGAGGDGSEGGYGSSEFDLYTLGEVGGGRPNDKLTQLRLVLTSDCLDSNGRFLAYSLWNVAANSAPAGQYTVTENFRDWPSDAGPAPHSSDGPNGFIDAQGTLLGLPGSTFNSLQHFTISGSGVGGNPTIPVRWNNGQDYAELGIWRAVPSSGSPYAVVLINGTQAATKAPVGTKCKNDPF